MKKRRARKKSTPSLICRNGTILRSVSIRRYVSAAIGDPVAHSLSPQMQNAALQASDIKMQYARFHILPNELQDALRMFGELDFVGLNLTVPHKIQPSVICKTSRKTRSEQARSAGQCEIRKIPRVQHRWLWIFARDPSKNFRSIFAICACSCSGAGGAARAIALQCARENCERLVVANRTLKGKAIVDGLRDFCGSESSWTGSEIAGCSLGRSGVRFQIANVDLVVNAHRALNRARMHRRFRAIARAASDDLRHGLFE